MRWQRHRILNLNSPTSGSLIACLAAWFDDELLRKVRCCFGETNALIAIRPRPIAMMRSFRARAASIACAEQS